MTKLYTLDVGGPEVGIGFVTETQAETEEEALSAFYQALSDFDDEPAAILYSRNNLSIRVYLYPSYVLSLKPKSLLETEDNDWE